MLSQKVCIGHMTGRHAFDHQSAVTGPLRLRGPVHEVSVIDRTPFCLFTLVINCPLQSTNDLNLSVHLENLPDIGVHSWLILDLIMTFTEH